MAGGTVRLMVLICSGIFGALLLAACGSDPDSLPTTLPPGRATTQPATTTGAAPATTTTRHATTTGAPPADFEVSVGAFRLYRGFPQDVSCTFEVEITNLGPDAASDLVVVVDIETPSPGAISVQGLRIDQGPLIPAGATQLFRQRLGINMQDPVPYFVGGQVEHDGVDEADFGGQLAIACNDPYEAP